MVTQGTTEHGRAPRDHTWKRIVRGMRPRMRASHIMAGVLCALLGFALVVQVRASTGDQLQSLRQEDLVRLLDEVSTRADQLDGEVARLRETRNELASGAGTAQAARDVAEQRATTEGILSGRLPAEGPGVTITVSDPLGALRAADLFNILEELRNAGAEVVTVGGVRLVTSTAFVDGDSGILVDGVSIRSPFVWQAIGNPATLDRALEIPGGALPSVRTKGATATTVQETLVEITVTADLRPPRWAKPVETNATS